MSNDQQVLTAPAATDDVVEAAQELFDNYQRMREQLSGVIVGMEDVTEQLMIGILCRGHCILQGMPGLAKTLLISEMASLLDLSYCRIQFTPDLMPADITGGEVLEEDRTTGETRVPLREGARIPQLDISGRNQPHAPEDAKRTPGSHGGAATFN